MKAKKQVLWSLFVCVTLLLILGNLNTIKTFISTPAQVTTPIDQCSIGLHPCSATIDNLTLTLQVNETPTSQKPLVFSLEAPAETIQSATLNLKGKEMYMGINQAVFAQTDPMHWQAETELAICTTGKMIWQAEVIIYVSHAVEPITATFEFEAK